MRAYFADLLEAFISPSFLGAVKKKYHYPEEDFESLCSVAKAMAPLMERDACWEHRLVSVGLHQEAEVSMTLGRRIDVLQEQYLSQGLLSESYMMEALASELLLQGYSAYNHVVAEETAYHVKRYHFLGSEENYPVERLRELLERLEMPVICNEAFCMIPKKSVAFVAELTKEAGVHCQGICVGCHSRNCPNRMEEGLNIGHIIADMTDVPLSYGYSRIFGKV